ncbi:hypothetical protein EDB19DRAFT_1768184 [Suillus lakei]|nr:hypothetical protein EDB19DRAFT_1768184 [Suillus lakei]
MVRNLGICFVHIQIAWLFPIHYLCIKVNVLSFSFRKHHQFSAMKFISLTTMVIAAAAMADVAIASEDLTTPINLRCTSTLQPTCRHWTTYLLLFTNGVGCSTALKGFNNSDNFG